MQPPAKKRRVETTAIEEIEFDPAARQEYLTGFHKRKLQRAKDAQEAAEKKARLEKIEERRKVRQSLHVPKIRLLTFLIKLREERKADLERHVQEVNALLKPLEDAENGEESQSEAESRETNSWNGISESPKLDRQAEYVEEDRYTTVTIEAMDVSKEGLLKADDDQQDKDAGDEDSQGEDNRAVKERNDLDKKRKWSREKPKDRLDRPKKKKKKFRYESKAERKVVRVKQKMRNSKQASARRAA
jgi:ribosomal RNA-processing protein 17